MSAKGKKDAVSKLVLVLVAAVIIVSASAIYFAMIGTTVSPFGSPTQKNSDNTISIEALSVDSSTSNLTATANVNYNSALTRMTLFINGTYVGSYNYTTYGAGQCCLSMMRSWSNGTSSYYFTATPYWMPMMNRWNWGDYGGGMMGGHYQGDRSYMITMMANFANGGASNASVIIVPNKQGTGWMCR